MKMMTKVSSRVRPLIYDVRDLSSADILICIVVFHSVDTFVAENPVPDEYAAKLLLHNNDYVTSDSGRVHRITTESFTRKSYSGTWGSGSKPKRSRRRRR